MKNLVLKKLFEIEVAVKEEQYNRVLDIVANLRQTIEYREINHNDLLLKKVLASVRQKLLEAHEDGEKGMSKSQFKVEVLQNAKTYEDLRLLI